MHCLVMFREYICCYIGGVFLKNNFTPKKIILFLLVFLSAFFNSSCSDRNDLSDSKISIVCTAFSQYDFVKEIVGEQKDDFKIKYLFDNGADVHSFESDIGFNVKIDIMESDLFIYNGGESDSWVENVITDKSMNKNCKTISLMECIDSENLINTSHQHEHHEHTHSCEDENCDENNFSLYDEHVWLSIPNAIKICQKIADEISAIDSENAKIYKENSEKYCNKLSALHKYAIDALAKCENPYLVVADRFPFVYMFSNYNIEYDSAFSGCTSETDATYENIIKLCNAVEDHNLKSLLVLEKSNSNISSSIISEVKKELKIYTVNSLQSVSADEIKDGFTYYTAMKNNIDVVLKALQAN